MTSHAIFESTLQKTSTWLDEIMFELGTESRREAYTALRAVLQTLRDRLTPQEALDLGSQLPMLIKGFYYDGWKPFSTPIKMDKDEFIAAVENRLRPMNIDFDMWGYDIDEPEAQLEAEDIQMDTEDITKAVFRVLSRKITQGELKDVKRVLPRDIRDFMP